MRGGRWGSHNVSGLGGPCAHPGGMSSTTMQGKLHHTKGWGQGVRGARQLRRPKSGAGRRKFDNLQLSLFLKSTSLFFSLLSFFDA